MPSTSVKVLVDPSITINSVDLSKQCSKVELAEQYDDVAVKAFGNVGELHRGGIYSASLKLTFYQGFDEVETNLRSVFGTVVPFVVKPDSDAVGVTNPSYSGSVLITQLGFSGGAGEAATVDVTFPVDGVIAVATT